jgi:hypothetical protein
MSNREKQSGSFNLFTLTFVATAICGAALLLMPAHATSEASAASDATYAGPTGYFPAEYVNQAKEIEPMPEMYY